MNRFGFLRVAAAVPILQVADCAFNAARTLELLREAQDLGTQLIVFPECGLTGYTCADLFHQDALINDAAEELDRLLEESESWFTGVAVVGLPVRVDGQLFNAAAVISRGEVLGVVPKSYLPNYKEFYDARYFTPARNAISKTIILGERRVPFGTDLLFECTNLTGFVMGVEICEDLWMPIPPSSLQALGGATVCVNLSASNETIGKATYRRQLVAGQSSRGLCGYIYASAGPGESTTDLVFGGHAMIAENGTIIQESGRFARTNSMIVTELDLERLQHDRTVTNSFHDAAHRVDFRRIPFQVGLPYQSRLTRPIDARPFIPADPATLNERCEEIFLTQVTGLAKRLTHIGQPRVSIGVSGGLDSTLALLVLCKTADLLGMPREQILGLTMPGFGTTSRTKGNATHLMSALEITPREADIRSLCFEQMRALDHAPFGIALEGETVETLGHKLRMLPAERRNDLVFENIQARMRTSLLMNAGFVIGTGDLSELCLGWCTYNADHMSMYNPNVSIPKTLVKFLVRWAAEHEFTGPVRDTLLDIVNTEISPELLPTSADGSVPQSTEGTIGPYELHDFFLYHLLRWGATPAKILFLAEHAKFDQEYTLAQLKKWLQLFLKRFFSNQFKRSCLPDGPKVGSVSVSPRGDWRMPSDAHAASWLLDELT